MAHTEPPNPYATGTSFPNAWGMLVIVVINTVLAAAVVGIIGCAAGCTSSHRARGTSTLGGSYDSRVERGPFSTVTRETARAPTADAVQGVMVSDAISHCYTQRERQSDRALQRQVIMGLLQARMGSQQWLAIVPPQWGHPSQWTDDHAYCVAIAMGMDPGTATMSAQPQQQPSVVQNPYPPWMTQVPYGYGWAGTPGVRK